MKLYKDEWWYPIRMDAAYVERLRRDYPDGTAGKDDATVRADYDSCEKYEHSWDHQGEAYDQFEPLADAFLLLESRAVELETENEALKKRVEELTDSVFKVALSAGNEGIKASRETLTDSWLEHLEKEPLHIQIGAINGIYELLKLMVFQEPLMNLDKIAKRVKELTKSSGAGGES